MNFSDRLLGPKLLGMVVNPGVGMVYAPNLHAGSRRRRVRRRQHVDFSMFFTLTEAVNALIANLVAR